MKRSAYLVAMTAFLWWAPGAMAADNSALALFTVGKYAAAEKAGVAEGDAQGYAIATRSVLADEMMHTPCLECLQRAEAYARQAIAADPKYPEGHIYLAVGVRLRSSHHRHHRSALQRLCRGSRGKISTTCLPSIRTMPGRWRDWAAGTSKSCAPRAIRWRDGLYGASVKTGREYFAKAFAVDPDNLVLRYQYALVLGAYDPETYRKEIEETLARAAAGTPHSEFDKFEQARARALLEAIKAGDLAELLPDGPPRSGLSVSPTRCPAR